ncbi:OsmC family protein [Mangrovimonas sp. AS39]|uniref:OsmC family protein n=1 Tax=Mangrovimonas futianensis TaxID=2895523 RepID=UPI001E5F3025|nr:OsmC family protein [Mangrovimonas futianensis]MCF1190449.1 OsmC family protein [Mangrovimonas futianensis]MCF1193799.1 OsmC family protein [Mangrovimonas futianensis]
MTDLVTTQWESGMLFESNNPSGNTFFIEASPEHGGQSEGLRPKALMLSSLAGCSGLDVVSLLKKMRVEYTKFKIDVHGELTEEHPKYYNKVLVEYHFHGSELDEKKIKKAVDLSVERYCGVMEMFRQFAEVKIAIHYHNH